MPSVREMKKSTYLGFITQQYQLSPVLWSWRSSYGQWQITASRYYFQRKTERKGKRKGARGLPLTEDGQEDISHQVAFDRHVKGRTPQASWPREFPGPKAGGGDTGWGQQRGHWAKIRDYVIKERTWFFNLTGHLRTVGFIIFHSRKGFRCHICLANVKQTEEFLSVFNMLMLKGEGYTISKSLSSTEFFGWMNTTPFGNQFGNVA